MPPEALGDAMNETMTPRDAARVLAQASTYEDSLQQRTEGLTAMLWGSVGPGIYLTYSYAYRLGDAFPEWAFSVLWLPWIFAGALTTFALWRSAALAMPHVKDPLTPMGYAWRFAALVLAVVAVFALWRTEHYGAPLLVIGGMYAVMAAFNPYRMSRRGRGVAAASGAALLLVGGIALALPETGVGYASVLLVSGLVPLLAGFWQTMTG